MKRRITTAISLLTCTFLVFVTLKSTTDIPVIAQVTEPTDVPIPHAEEIAIPALSLLFVGDIMLGRVVETLMNRNGLLYPFQGIQELLLEPNITIGNFEGVVTPVHEHAKPMTFAFSIKDSFLEHLSTVGFDILSLANNHSNDYGPSARAYMRSRCDVYKINCIGVPTGLDETSTFVQKIDGRRVGFIFIHTLYGEPDENKLRELTFKLSAESDVQIAYVHWGEEYELSHNRNQEAFAETLIDSGLDAVIGHHPHVVQDIALYKGKPIFYSLGNFIFDQYFSDAVTQMIALSMNIGVDTITYDIVPLTSKTTRSQPHLMEDAEGKLLFSRIFNGILQNQGVNAQDGQIVVSLR